MKPIGTGTRRLTLNHTAWTRQYNTVSIDVDNYIDAKSTIHNPMRHSFAQTNPQKDTPLYRLHMIRAQAAQDIPKLDVNEDDIDNYLIRMALSDR